MHFGKYNFNKPEHDVQLWICDVQEIFSGKLLNEEYFFFIVKLLAEFALIVGLTIKVTEQYPEKLGPTHCDLRKILPSDQRYIGKTKFSMTQCLQCGPEPPKDEYRPQYIALCGIEAHICIYQTAMDLIELNHKVIIIVDGVTSQRRFERDEAFKTFYSHPKIMTMTFESFVYAFMKDKEHPKFKEVLCLVKKLAREYPHGGDEF